MARINAADSDAVKIEKLRIDLEKFRILESHKTWRYFILSFFGAVSVGVIAWATVRMTDKPAWLELGLAIVALFSGQTFLLFGIRRWLFRIRVEMQRSLADREEFPEEQP